MFSIKTRIIFSYSAIFGILAVLFSIVTFQYIRRINLTKMDTQLMAGAELLEEVIEEGIEEMGDKVFSGPMRARAFAEVSRQGVRLTGVRGRIVDRQGNDIVADPMLPKAEKKDWERVFAGEEVFSQFTIDGHRYRSVKHHIADEEEHSYGYVLELAASMEELEAQLTGLARLFWIAIPIAFLVAGAAAYFITRIAFRPISRMVETAETISATNLDKRLHISNSRDEIHHLAETFNRMFERIDNAFKTQRRFVTNASHELRTPLTVIQAELELAHKHTDHPEAFKSIDIALREIECLNDLTNALLMLARLDSSENHLEKSPVRLDELVIECIQSLRHPAEKKQIRMVPFFSEGVEITADRAKIKAVIRNLLANAIKYSPAKSKVRVCLTCVPPGKENQVRLVVEDFGAGIAPEALPHIFDRFYRAPATRAEVPGNGLGLAITKRIIQLHGGGIRVESQPGEGTRFYVTLPA